jgi:hypothetical protein
MHTAVICLMIGVVVMAHALLALGAHCTQDRPILMGVLTAVYYGVVAKKLYDVYNSPTCPVMVRQLAEVSHSASCGSSFLKVLGDIALFVCVPVFGGACLVYNTMVLQNILEVLKSFIDSLQ